DVDDPGLIILPETALPAPALQAAGSTPEEWTRRWANRLGAPLLVGAINPVQALAGEEFGREGSYTNSAIVAQPYASDDAVVSRYDKEILVPFAERVPFANVIPALGALSVPAGGVERYVNGSQSAPLTVDGVEVGVLICFESLFPQLARRRVRAGADILVVLTQDGWWRSNAARRQHLLFSRMRAVETGRPLVQVSVDGESGVFDQRGRLRVLMDSGVPAAQTVDIPLSSRRTLYGATGDTPVQILIFVLLIAATVRMFTPGPTGAHPQPESATGP
ncbi:MAG: apolipoprotein N-acyltransferase, partial [Rhodothermales bacterium]|nr:apolipoprotein N-acyltransferase [Rhodothermales bacterium]